MDDSLDIRAFLAVDMDKNLIERIVEVQELVNEVGAPVKFVEPENLHFTIKFFGDVNEEKLNQIKSIIDKGILKFSPFEINIHGMGVFPSLRYIRVVWLGTSVYESFSNLQKEFDQEFVKVGFKKERSYIPHLTIGRLKGSNNKELLVEKIQELNDIDIGNIIINQLILKKSELTPSGPIYTNIETYEL